MLNFEFCDFFTHFLPGLSTFTYTRLHVSAYLNKI